MESTTPVTYGNNNPFGYPANQSPTTSFGDWIVTIFISSIPVVGFIMLLVWAFSSGTPASKANWARATLAFVAVFVVLGILFAGSLIAALSNLGNSRN